MLNVKSQDQGDTSSSPHQARQPAGDRPRDTRGVASAPANVRVLERYMPFGTVPSGAGPLRWVASGRLIAYAVEARGAVAGYCRPSDVVHIHLLLNHFPTS